MIHTKKDTLMEIVSQLRDAYDGSSRNIYGTGKDTIYRSKFGIVAAVTNVIDKHRGVLAELGERFLTYRCPDISEEESIKRCWKVSSKRSVTEQETELKQLSADILKQPTHKVVISESFRSKIIEIASYVARARCEITRDPYTKEPEIPTPEVATRLTRQLCDLAIGISIVRGNRYITKDVSRLIKKIALDSLTLKRLRLLRELYDVFPAGIRAKKLAEKTYFSESVVRRWLEDLLLLGLIQKKAVKGQTVHLAGYETIWNIKYKPLLKSIWK